LRSVRGRFVLQQSALVGAKRSLDFAVSTRDKVLALDLPARLWGPIREPKHSSFLAR
jgi:hypothetical protein